MLRSIPRGSSYFRIVYRLSFHVFPEGARNSRRFPRYQEAKSSVLSCTFSNIIQIFSILAS
jgi:hypothetical protein